MKTPECYLTKKCLPGRHEHGGYATYCRFCGEPLIKWQSWTVAMNGEIEHASACGRYRIRSKNSNGGAKTYKIYLGDEAKMAHKTKGLAEAQIWCEEHAAKAISSSVQATAPVPAAATHAWVARQYDTAERRAKVRAGTGWDLLGTDLRKALIAHEVLSIISQNDRASDPVVMLASLFAMTTEGRES